MEKKLSQLKSGVILSYINLVLGCIIPMIYTPIMLRLLGKSEYGLYSIANSVISYLSVLNFGLGSTIIRYISKYRALNQKEEEEKDAKNYANNPQFLCGIFFEGVFYEKK